MFPRTLRPSATSGGIDAKSESSSTTWATARVASLHSSRWCRHLSLRWQSWSKKILTLRRSGGNPDGGRCGVRHACDPSLPAAFPSSGRGVRKMWRAIFITFLLAHAAIHIAIWATPTAKMEDAPFDASKSWILDSQRSLAMLVAAAAAVLLAV